MPPLLGFMIENSIGNSVPIFLGALVVAYIAGPFLKNVGANKYVRIVIYSVVGVITGLWAYSSFNIPDRSIEAMEAFTLAAGMLIYSLLIVSPFVLFKNRASKT